MARHRDEVVGELQKDLRISEKGKKTGILQVALEGPDRGADRRDPRHALAQVPPPERRAEERGGRRRRSSSWTTQLPIAHGPTSRPPRSRSRTYRAREGVRGRDARDARRRSSASVERREGALGAARSSTPRSGSASPSSHPVLVASRDKSGAARGRARRASTADESELPEAELESAPGACAT